MKFLVVFAALILVISATSDKDQWLQFKEKYGRYYRNLKEEQQRFSIFKDNLVTIQEHNEKYAKGETSYYMGVTPFADLTPTEFISMLNSSRPIPDLKLKPLVDVDASAAPSAIDWRDKGVVSEVKNQGGCGGCWAFSATGAMEAAYAIKTGNHISLSEQNLIDCSTSYGNSGCSGGTIHSAFQYVMEVGIQAESDYAYQGRDGSCSYSQSKSVLKISNYVALSYDNERELQNAVGTIGPVSVSIDANGFQLYSGGIYDDSTCTWTVNHGVLVVGYGEESGTEYWIVKNSWGSDWGMSGYIKMARNKNDQCGIGLWGVYPVI
ncbi:cathepsin L-like proteinase [Anoplophora glabripennis]|uniref:cathepsin L-like proteinase n=1 Tax=Anoplophora glabripennis TaxID=217634 RepID=UPI000C77DDFB|nr:cathepsin L-like proteinase [Anoplophora glabripennis]